VAIVMVVVLGMTGMALDLGNWWKLQTHLQSQVDAGALAGADQLLQNPASCPGTIQTVADQYAAPNTTTSGSDPVPTTGVVSSNGQAGKVTAKTTVACPGSGSYIDMSVTNSSPGAIFSGLNPPISAHARVNLLQVGSAGGTQVLPYAITKTQAQSCCNNLVKLVVNNFSFLNPDAYSQSLVCDGSKTSAATNSGQLMLSFEQNGCPTTQVSASPATCQTTSPPSCLAEFNGVDEQQYDIGEMRFNNNQAFGNIGIGGRGTCANAGPNANPLLNPPVSTDYAYQLPTLRPNDPRLITLFVVPDTVNGQPSFQYSNNNNVHMIPIIGYAAFYLAGWDHDPCLLKSPNPLCPTSATPGAAAPPAGTACDPPDPVGRSVGSIDDTGAVWGYYVKNIMPASSGATGTVACNPIAGDAVSADCVAQMSQ
jgi:hypothetical protein